MDLEVDSEFVSTAMKNLQQLVNEETQDNEGSDFSLSEGNEEELVQEIQNLAKDVSKINSQSVSLIEPVDVDTEKPAPEGIKTPQPQAMKDWFPSMFGTETAAPEPKPQISAEKFEQTTLRRMAKYHMKKEVGRKKVKETIEAKQKADETFKPAIDKESQRLSSGIVPIYDRVKVIQEDAQKTREAIKTEMEKNRADPMEDVTFNPNIGNKKGPARTTDEFLAEMQEWAGNRQKTLETLAQKKQQTEKSTNTFAPRINPKSAKIVASKQSQNHVPVEERLEEYQKKNEQKRLLQMLQSTPTFKPDISPAKQRVGDSHSHLPAHERLYRSHPRSTRAPILRQNLPTFGTAQTTASPLRFEELVQQALEISTTESGTDSTMAPSPNAREKEFESPFRSGISPANRKPPSRMQDRAAITTPRSDSKKSSVQAVMEIYDTLVRKNN